VPGAAAALPPPPPRARSDDALRYPIGPTPRVTRLAPEDRAAALAAIADCPRALRAAVAGLSDAQLDTPYRPGGWTVRQVVHHVADSHANAYVRCKLTLTEDNPTIRPYEEQRWAELPEARSADPALSLALLDALHARWSAALAGLGPEAFARPYVHPANGPGTFDGLLATYAWHGRHHVAHVTGLRAREGWGG
jgi:uncharacterized damage-inducible protein DinB